VPVFLEQRDDFQRQLLSRTRANLKELDHLLTGQKACSRLALEGGWYVVLRVPSTRSEEELALEFLSCQNVHVHPGHFYDFPSDGYLVVSLITPEAILAKGITGMLKFLS
jgi:aspartate/methionine/tyrosine aminotransferase